VLERVIVAGFGGQGVVFFGKLLAQAVMHEGRNVICFPAYGPEVRGGRANCHVTISSGEIFSPMVAQPDTLIVMNQPSWDFYSPRLGPGGLILANTSLLTPGGGQLSGRLLCLRATDLANDLGDVRVANMVMLGAYNHVRELLPVEALLEHLRAALTGGKAALFDLNRQAIHKGIEAARGASPCY